VSAELVIRGIGELVTCDPDRGDPPGVIRGGALAARDGVLGAGTLVSCAREDGAVAWLLAGSVSDAVDAAVLVAALREGKVRGWAAQAATAGAIAGALAGAAATLDVVRHR